MPKPHSSLSLYSGVYLAYTATFLAKKGGETNSELSDLENKASFIIREYAVKELRPGDNPLDNLDRVTRRALNAIENNGIEAFVAAHHDNALELMRLREQTKHLPAFKRRGQE